MISHHQKVSQGFFVSFLFIWSRKTNFSNFLYMPALQFFSIANTLQYFAVLYTRQAKESNKLNEVKEVVLLVP